MSLFYFLESVFGFIEIPLQLLCPTLRVKSAAIKRILVGRLVLYITVHVHQCWFPCVIFYTSYIRSIQCELLYSLLPYWYPLRYFCVLYSVYGIYQYPDLWSICYNSTYTLHIRLRTQKLARKRLRSTLSICWWSDALIFSDWISAIFWNCEIGSFCALNVSSDEYVSLRSLGVSESERSD